jgi:uncharacterized protein YacL
MEKSRSLKLSQNALYYAVASFFLFGLLLGFMGFKDAQQALKQAEDEQERIKAKRVRILSIIGMSGPVINLLLVVFLTGEFSIRSIIWSSWLLIIIVNVLSFVIT